MSVAEEDLTLTQAPANPMDTEDEAEEDEDETENRPAAPSKAMDTEAEEEEKPQPTSFRKIGGKPTAKGAPKPTKHRAGLVRPKGAAAYILDLPPLRHRHMRGQTLSTMDTINKGLRAGTLKRLLIKGCVLIHGTGLVETTRAATAALIMELTRKACILEEGARKKTLTVASLLAVAKETVGVTVYPACLASQAKSKSKSKSKSVTAGEKVPPTPDASDSDSDPGPEVEAEAPAELETDAGAEE
jgi:hypothetical protein